MTGTFDGLAMDEALMSYFAAPDAASRKDPRDKACTGCGRKNRLTRTEAAKGRRCTGCEASEARS